MTARQVVIGCSVTALLALVVVVVGGFLIFRHLVSPAPMPGPMALVATESVGVAVLRLESDNTWLREGFSRLAGPSGKSSDMDKLTPLEVVWTARRAAPASEGHLVTMNLAPSGRLLGLSLDIALWKAGRSGLPNAQRVVHGGEGITSFSRLPGQFFVRGSTIAWASDLEAARRGVDLLIAGEEGKAPPPSPSSPSAPLLDLYPSDGRHALRGAVIDAEGSLARVLAALPGAASPPPDLSGVEGLSFTLDPSSASEGTGALTLRYAPAATPEQRQRTSAALAAWIQTVSPGGLRLQASAGGTGADVLTIGAAGMEDVFKKLLRAAARAERAMKKEQEPEPDPKDQSSSTFQ